MPIIYFDNFRGFNSTFLTLKDVNFFVGENSTGKSSILKLIGILSSPGFWRYNIFGEKETELGTFSEIKSANVKQDFFEIGLLAKKSVGLNTAAFKLRFIEKENYPLLKEICYRDETINIQATIETSILKYRFQQINSGSIAERDAVSFKNWIKNNGFKSETFLRSTIETSAIEQLLYKLSILINKDLTSTKNDLIEAVRIVIPNLYNNMAWFAPAVVGPQKTYDQVPLVFNPTGIHSASVLREILADNNDVQAILNRFGLDSGLFDSIRIINLSKESEDTFEIQVVIDNKPLNIKNVGYGVSQVLPLLIEAIARPNESWIVAQQPETHLHPMAQAAIGDFVFKSNEVDGQKFILETHSDYIIDRFRLRVQRAHKNDKNATVDLSQIIFFSKNNAGNTINVLDIKPDGSYSEKQPAGFRDFFIKEQFALIQI